MTDTKPIRPGIYFKGIPGLDDYKRYPAWRYHKINDPFIVQNTEEDEKAKLDGYEPINIPISANKYLSNWFWDLEDLSQKQLVVFAQEEYGVDLPIEAGQERLLKAVLELSKAAPQNQGRIVLMAHTIRMNYDETLSEIRRMTDKGMSEVETMEFEA
jgi:hypothetical protein